MRVRWLSLLTLLFTLGLAADLASPLADGATAQAHAVRALVPGLNDAATEVVSSPGQAVAFAARWRFATCTCSVTSPK